MFFFLNTFLAGRKGVFLKVKMFKINRGIGTRLFLLLFLGVFLDCLVLCGRSPERAKKKASVGKVFFPVEPRQYNSKADVYSFGILM